MMVYNMLVLLILSLGTLSAENVNGPTIVTLPDGQIRGHTLFSENNKLFYAFQEIPYASPPIGSLRFKPPIKPQKWNGVLNVTKNTKMCYQSNNTIISNVTETEDCLYLNVYTPVEPGKASKPPLAVLMWIHGGGFGSGAGVLQSFKPQLFIDFGIVVVTINYRLGPLGFLTTEDGVIPGNIGLKDQQMALLWIKTNINLFGGDSGKITIAGQSAGAGATGLQLLNKNNKRLFRGAILESGSPVCQFSHQNYARFYAFELGRSLDPNFTSNNSRDLLALLQKVPAYNITKNTITPAVGKETGIYEGEGLIWAPVIEDPSVKGAVVIGPFHDDIKNGKSIKVPLLIGFTTEECISFDVVAPSSPELHAKFLDKDLSNLVRNRFKMSKEDKLTAGKELRNIYTNGSFGNNLSAVVRFDTDQYFTTGIIRHAQLEAKFSDVFLYQFSYKGKMGGFEGVEIAGVEGVGHSEELGYLWDVTSDGTPDDSKDLVERHRLLTLWSNFVKYLNPTPRKDSSLGNVTWNPVTPNNLVYLNINSTLQMKTNPKQYKKWERIIDKYAIPPLVNY